MGRTDTHLSQEYIVASQRCHLNGKEAACVAPSYSVMIAGLKVVLFLGQFYLPAHGRPSL